MRGAIRQTSKRVKIGEGEERRERRERSERRGEIINKSVRRFSIQKRKCLERERFHIVVQDGAITPVGVSPVPVAVRWLDKRDGVRGWFRRTTKTLRVSL